METIFKFLPYLFSLLAQGGKIRDIANKALALLHEIMALIPQTQSAPVLDVKWVQTSLKAQGFDPGAVDGDYGARTKAAVTAYQTARGLDVDGWVGPQTMASLMKDANP